MSNSTRTVQRVKAKIKKRQIEKGRKRIHNLGTGLSRAGYLQANAYELGYNQGWTDCEIEDTKEPTNETP